MFGVDNNVQTKIITHKYTFFLAVGIGLLVVLLVWTRPELQTELVESVPLHVSVTQVKMKDLQPDLWLGGTLRPAQRAELQFQVAGRILERLVEPGHQVEQGQPLLRLEEQDYQDRLTEARARWQQEKAAVKRDRKLLELAEKNRELQQAEVKRQQSLGHKSLASRAGLDASRQRLLQLEADEERLRHSVATAESRIAILQAALNRVERDWQRTTLKAPFAGTVNRVITEVGDDVTAKQVVLELMRVDQLDFYAEVSGETASQLSLGQVIEIKVAGQRQLFAAELIAIQKDPDPKTYTHAIRARFANPDVLPGTAVESRVLLKKVVSATVVPVAAVVHEEGKAYVFVVKDQVLQRRLIQLGPRQDDIQVVMGELQVDELIVSRNVAVLKDGLPVQY